MSVIINNPTTCVTSNADLRKRKNIYGIFTIKHYIIQISPIKVRRNRISHFELIIVDNSEKTRKMVVLTANTVYRELYKLDYSRMRENEIIDMNEEGRRWEGGELDGKPDRKSVV